MSNSFLLKIADVLDALAEEKSSLESQISSIKEAQRKEKLEPVINKLSFITGRDEHELTNKLANVDEDVLSMLRGLTQDSSMGGPGSAKTASVVGVNTSDRADNDFASWILS
jgi:hypothetical protein